jgi:hypothetical protein
LERSRQRALGELKRLPETLKCLERGPEYQVTVSERLKNLARQVEAIQSQSTTPDRQERKPLEQAVTS